MKILKTHILLLNTLFLIVFISSCSKDDSLPQEEYQQTKISENVTDLFIAKGNTNADTVWIYEQGGPSGNLEEFDLSLFPNHNNYLNVYVHQVLTYNNNLYNKQLTVEQGELETAVNSEILHKVIQHFKNQGKKVIVIGHSYGALVVTNYLANKGSSLADKYVILAGRLDIQQDFYKGFINKQFYYFPDFITPTLHPTIQPTNNKDGIELFLAGIISKPRYTQELSNVDLTKVIFSWANDDIALGRLTMEEKNFLLSKNVKIVEITNGGHGAMFTSPNNLTIYNLMTQ